MIPFVYDLLCLPFTLTIMIKWIFNVILTPEYNAAHADHFHVDLTPGAHSIK